MEQTRVKFKRVILQRVRSEITRGLVFFFRGIFEAGKVGPVFGGACMFDDGYFHDNQLNSRATQSTLSILVA